ncbi:MAG: sulfotransferase domain-containing protein [Pseudanabaenaceae cyanobacterium SKYGB_i_bin29]|nr:sulfotransferase domain-containing protein [Pseudanabaenaceae cyanobacterium SKYG29]MDW8420817.1 sulfotransferase domain-containing protein [Pseudanabaenaceae cyanobacterium SKYGB_i_bin29]
MTKVNFLIVGTQKGGTTALAKFLSQHPDICLAPVKEVHFFDYDRHYHLGIDYYHSFFPNYRGQKLIGEATPIYMYLPHIAPRIAEYNPQMKLIVLLRNPIDRAYSHYQMELQRQWEILPFAVAIALEPLRLSLPQNLDAEKTAKRVCSYCHRGFYTAQLRNLYRYFPREQVLVLLQEDLANDHSSTLEKVYAFLGVESPPQLPPPDRVLVGNYQPLSPWLRQILKQYFRREIENLQRLLDRDLSHWLKSG